MNCQSHPQRKATAVCTKCGRLLCEECAVQDRQGNFFCSDCLPVKKAADKKSETVSEQMVDNLKTQAVDTVAAAGRAVQGAKATAMQGILVGVGGFRHFQFRRAVAFLIDVLLAGMIILFSVLIAEFMLPLWDVPPSAASLLGKYIGFLFGGTIYYVGVQGFGGRTVGKRMVGLRVIRMVDGKPMGWLTAFWRWVGMLNMVLWTSLGWLLFQIALRVYRMGAKMNIPVTYRLIWLGVTLGIVLFLSSGVLIAFMGRNRRGLHDIIAGTRLIDLREGEL